MKTPSMVLLASVLTLVGSVFSIAAAVTPPAAALYAGFVPQPLRLDIQHPYDLKLEERYSYDQATDTHDLWVLGTDTEFLVAHFDEAFTRSRHINYQMLADIASNTNTPIDLVQKVVASKDLPVGAVYPARDALKLRQKNSPTEK